MHRGIRFFLALLTALAAVGWTYLINRLDLASAWGSEPNQAVRLTLCALPYLILGYNLAACRWVSRPLCLLGLVVNFPGVLVTAAWFNHKGGLVLGYSLLFYLFIWYTYAFNVLRPAARHETRPPLKPAR